MGLIPTNLFGDDPNLVKRSQDILIYYVRGLNLGGN